MAKAKKTKEQKLEDKQNDIESKKGLSKLELLDIAIAKIEKDFGKGTIASAGGLRGGDEDYISSGSIELNLKLTGTPHRGYARGTIVEIFGWESSGKSSLAQSAAGLIQKNGGIVAYIDAEHALDPEYAKKLGFDTDKAVICQPGNGEEGLNVAKQLCESNAVDLIIIDSVATLVPKAEMEGEIGDQFMGLQARMMSQALRELTPAVSKSKTVVIFINQMRMKIGVMFGCFHYDTLVNFVDGRSIPIGKVVDEQIVGDVYSYNPNSGLIEIKPITAWHYNGNVEVKEDFLHIQTNSIDGTGRFGFTCTPNHEILTDSGWKMAKDISYNDQLISKYNRTINGTYEQFLNGVFIGDSNISIRSKNTGSLRLQDNENKEYLNWKLDKLSPFINFTERKVNSGFRYDSDYNYELAKVKSILGERNPEYMFNNYSDLSLAIWIMDDGNYDIKNNHNRYSISVKRFKNNSIKLDKLVELFKNNGLECAYNLSDGYIQFKTDQTNKIASRICKYVPESMQYKLPEEFKGKYEEFELTNSPEINTEYVSIKEIRIASDRQMRNKRKFDISIKDNKNYMVGGYNNGVIVHNSPETTAGGNALKFYASQRLEIRRGDSFGPNYSVVAKDEDNFAGIFVKVKVVKNKIAPPFKKTEVPLLFESGIDNYYELLELGVLYDLIGKSGSWYSYNGEKVAQGKTQGINYLKQNPKIGEEIINAIKTIDLNNLPILEPAEETAQQDDF